MDYNHCSPCCQLGLWMIPALPFEDYESPLLQSQSCARWFLFFRNPQKRLAGKRLATLLYVRSVICTGTRDGVLSIVAILLDERPRNLGLVHGEGQTRFTLQRCPDWVWGTTVRVLNGYLGFFPVVRRPGREVDHACSSSAELKNVWS
jgi:hypothetical protein